MPAKRSTELPYTHPQSVKSFKVAQSNNEAFLITAGGEGNIRIWKYEAARNGFEHQMLLEGHVRAINCMALVDKFLWSGSNDRTIRVWDVTNGTCVGVLSGSNMPNTNMPGHTDSVSFLEVLPAVNGKQCIVFLLA